MANKKHVAQRFTDELLALAYELRTEGCKWRHIATGLGVHPARLRNAVAYRLNRRGRS